MGITQTVYMGKGGEGIISITVTSRCQSCKDPRMSYANLLILQMWKPSPREVKVQA